MDDEDARAVTDIMAVVKATKVLLREQVDAALWYLDSDKEDAGAFRDIQAALDREDVATAAREYLKWVNARCSV